MSDFAKNLRYYRKQKRLSQAELAKALNYGDTTIPIMKVVEMSLPLMI